ncbi:MAG: methyltransferase [Actinomycetota bacterium]
MGDDRRHQEHLVVGDAFGNVLTACDAAGAAQGAAFEVIERSDGYVRATDAARYFAPHDQWGPTARFACDQAVGRTLDIGAGAGRLALALQGRDREVVALDVSPGAVAVSRRRGVVNTFNGTVFDLARTSPEPFDSFVMLGNNLGLLGGADQAPEFLAALAAMARPGARIVGETLDPYGTTDPDHLRYHEANRRLGRLPGQLRLRVRDGQVVTPWWDYLFCTPEELGAVVAPTRWVLTDSYRSPSTAGAAGPAWPPGQWVALLTLGA